MRPFFQKAFRILSSFGLTCIILVFLGLLTWLGTLEQVDRGLYQVQKDYFESFFLIYRVGFLGIPLPGANLLLCALFVNLICGGIVRLRKSWSRVGILVGHVGIGLLLLSGFVKLYFSDYGQMTLYEGQRANTFSDYNLWELAITRDLGDGQIEEFLVPEEDFVDLTSARPVTLHRAGLPFDLEISNFMVNCWPEPKNPGFMVTSPVVEGIFLRPLAVRPAQEQNVAGLYAVAVDKITGERHEGILWGLRRSPSTAAARTPWTVVAGGDTWGIELRHKIHTMPFGLQLEVFTKEDHARMDGNPKWFSSDVLVMDGETERPLQISMNQPLRKDGYVVYQASWGPPDAGPMEPLFSSLAVSRNPSDKYPLIACIVIAVGLLWHLSRKLGKYIRSEARSS